MKKVSRSKKIDQKKGQKTTSKNIKGLQKSEVSEKNVKEPSQEITFRIQRVIQGKTEMRDYKIEVGRGDTILDCLDKIRDDLDPSLSFRRNCRNTICGSCAMTINGRARLACKEHALNLIDKETTKENTKENAKEKIITITPMRNMPVVKDLVNDMTSFWNQYKKIKPWVDTGDKPLPEKEFLMSIEQFQELEQSADCIMCGLCYADSNGVEAEKEFLGPAALARAYRLIADPRDAKQEERIKAVDNKHGTWDCMHCFYCTEVCPVDVDPLAQILKIRKMAVEKGSTKTRGAMHHLTFIKSVKDSGILNENKLPIGSIGGIFNIVGMFEITPVGFRMLTHGKMPSLIHHKIPKIEDVREIFNHFKKESFKKKDDSPVNYQ